jgi:hypothetical protein
MEPLSRELANICYSIEKHWITQIHALKKEGKTYGDQEFDIACANLSAVVDEFYTCE